MIEFWREEWGDSYHMTGLARFALGAAQLQAGDHGAAEPGIRVALEVLRKNARETSDPVLFAEVEAALAECLTARGSHGEAEAFLSRAHERVREYGKHEPSARRLILERVVALYEAWGKQAEAAKWRDLGDGSAASL